LLYVGIEGSPDMIVLVLCGFIGACCGMAGVKGMDA
jgi:hypothetical protein